MKKCEGCGIDFLAKDGRNRFCTRSCALSGKRSYLWKGDDVGIDALHTYMRKHVPSNGQCQNCGEKKKLDLANISNEYKREVSDWEWLCRKCHMQKDGRLTTFLSHSNMNKKLATRNCKYCDKEFEPSDAKVVFCSKSCAATYTNLFKRDYAKKKIT